ncbi:hypothetical protein [Proteiniclasticum ruminis]|uniref:Uncharacterized protein n=1 Tax=Proteiniclasticum ruminis TaxID=398199 RepID=A0A1I5EY55_9CLOT|nr:hypothetical protein [Proteiniclasticum ruminis]SFO16397.1 hypothetical protein SAMN04488695_1234 [Proteiniclasticum ruminis]
MIKLLHVSDISKIAHLEEEVQTYGLEALTILDEEYGTDRDSFTDLGGYVVILENLDDIQELEALHNIDLTKNPLPEFVDLIYPEKGPRYTASLYLLSSDYGIIIILPYDMTPKEILKK